MIYRSFDPFSPIPDTVLPELIVDTKPKEQEAKNDLLSNTGNTLTVGGVIYSEFGNTIANKNFWIDAKGNYKSTDLLNKQADDKYVRGVQGYRNGYNSALKAASKYQAAGKVVGGLGIGITVWEIGSGQKNLIGEGGLDLIMGSIGFTGWGAPISLIYFGGKYILQETNNDFWNK